jgi:hypothetical protein
VRKKKVDILGKIDLLDKIAETKQLSEQEMDARMSWCKELDDIWKIEEIKASRGQERKRLRKGIRILLISLRLLTTGKGIRKFLA